MASKKQGKKSQHAAATVIHAANKDGVHHVVGIGNIRVVIIQEGPGWFAQGLEIDYAAQGSSVDDVKRNFENGLTATIEQHLSIFGSIKGVLETAPKEVWQDMLLEDAAIHNFYSQVSGHIIHAALPFEGINYLVAKAKAESCV